MKTMFMTNVPQFGIEDGVAEMAFRSGDENVQVAMSVKSLRLMRQRVTVFLLEHDKRGTVVPFKAPEPKPARQRSKKADA